MIVAASTQQPVGSVINPLAVTDADGNRNYGQPLFVIREATFQEWREDVIREGGNPDQWEPYPYHYEVTTD